MNEGLSKLGLAALVGAAVYHLLAVLSPAWWQARDNDQGRDFASYYYAVQVAADGGDPYDTRQLSAAAAADGTRGAVHPYLYAPPFLLSMAWVLPYDLSSAYHLWFWLHEVTLLVAVAVLWGWQRERSPALGWLLAALVAAMTAVPNNHLMGQANFPGLALAFGGLWAQERGRPWLGGALLGAACMLKMSPALLVMWWLLRRDLLAALAAVLTAIALSVAALPLASLAVQRTFFVDVLPSFGSGAYNGLGVAIGIFGNHSLPNLFHQLAPSGAGVLSPLARGLAWVANLGLLGGLAVWFRGPRPTPLARFAQVGAVGVVMLLFPVYTYEHHLVWAIPAALAAMIGVERGRLGAGWAIATGVGVACLAFELAALKRWAELPEASAALGWVLMELKTVGLLLLLAAAARLGREEAA